MRCNRAGRAFNRWPNGWGFDYFYGFLGGGSGQADVPCLAENQKIIGTPDAYYENDEDDPYYLPDDMADKTIELEAHAIRAQHAVEAVLHLLLHWL